MSCCLFTWHAYGTWYPDRPQGYVHWQRGYCETNVSLASAYRRNQTEESAVLSLELQRIAIEEVLQAAPLQRFRAHAMGGESTHLHVLASWRHSRTPEATRTQIRHPLTKRLHQEHNRKWFARGGDIQRVRSRSHFDYLVNVYLPSHSGYKWDERRGLYV